MLLYNFRFFVKNQVFIGVWANIHVFKLILLVNLLVFIPSPTCFCNCISVIELDVRDVMSLEVPLLSKIVLAIWGFFHMKLIMFSFKVCEKLCCDFDGDCIESRD